MFNYLFLSYLCIDIYRFIFASLLAVFIPQKCEDTTCSFGENISGLSNYNSFVIGFNIFTAILLLLSLYFEWKRERLCKSYLTIDFDTPDDFLQTHIHLYPEIEKDLLKSTYRYRKLTDIITIVYSINLIITIPILYYYYLDSQTITTFITYAILIFDRILLMRKVSSATDSSFIIYSSYISNQSIFNKVTDYKKEDKNKLDIVIDKFEDQIEKIEYEENIFKDQLKNKFGETRNKIENTIIDTVF